MEQGEFLGMDLPKALLSPKRLGPETEFAPVPIEARTDRKQVKTERVIVPEVAERAVVPEIAARPKVAERKARVVQDRVEKPRGAARAKLARRHSNPLDAQARDTRIQTWPCRSGAHLRLAEPDRRRNSSGAASGRYVQIAADDNQGGERKGDAENRGCNRGQPVGIQPVLQRSAHRSLIRS